MWDGSYTRCLTVTVPSIPLQCPHHGRAGRDSMLFLRISDTGPCVVLYQTSGE